MRRSPGSILRRGGRWMSTASLAILLTSLSAAAHPPAQLSAEQEKGTAEEVKAFRKDVAAAIAARDAKRLRRLYVDGFRHIQPDGRIAGRDAHVAALLAGAPGIELLPATDMDIRIPGGWTAIVTARANLPAEADGKRQDIRWLAVYVRVGDGWQIAASQITRLTEK